MGDLNDYRSSDEKIGGTHDDNRCGLFNDRLSDCELDDLRATGPIFTWWGPMIGSRRVRVKLDRAVASNEWKFAFPESQASVLPRLESDHHPILLSTCRAWLRSGKKPFRFQAAWLLHKDFN